MPKLIVSVDGVVISEMQLTKERTTFGRRPYNDIVIDNLAVSGEHAVFRIIGEGVQLQDLNSTNGSYVNGRPVKKQYLSHEDVIEIGKCQIKFLSSAAPAEGGAAAAHIPARIEFTQGAAAGRVVELVKPVTTLGKAGVSVVAISKMAQGFSIEHMDGEDTPLLNGQPMSAEPHLLQPGDTVELAGTGFKFSQG
jgi:pSer/pThr/pTyr-binding forkhead associated (FHA) protein